jgi:DNA-binding transcriptional regulator YdaS (Cro superfamily)
MDTPLNRATQAAGGVTALARLMGVQKQLIVSWRTRGVPVERCAQLEAETGRAVMRWDLRPDDWHRIWPELVGMPGAPKIPSRGVGADQAIQKSRHGGQKSRQGWPFEDGVAPT